MLSIDLPLMQQIRPKQKSHDRKQLQPWENQNQDLIQKIDETQDKYLKTHRVQLLSQFLSQTWSAVPPVDRDIVVIANGGLVYGKVENRIPAHDSGRVHVRHGKQERGNAVAVFAVGLHPLTLPLTISSPWEARLGWLGRP